MMSSEKIEPEIDAADICERLVGITSVYLNNFLQRGLFGLMASVQAGKLREKRRRFSREDAFGIALVWLLFESGLRTDPTIRVLKDIVGSDKASANANRAAKKLLESKADYLVISRQPRMPTKKPLDKPGQTVRVAGRSEVAEMLAQYPASELLLIPVGHKFDDVRKRMEMLFGG
jgi:hypothetical protein